MFSQNMSARADDASEDTQSRESSPLATAAAGCESMTLELALEVAGWPASLASQRDKHATIVRSVDEFERLLLFGGHLDRILVLRDGVRLLGLEQALPAEVADAAVGETCVRRFLQRLGDDTALQQLRGRVYLTPKDSKDEVELRRGADGAELDTLADKRAALAARDPEDSVYVGELRRAHKYRHPADNRWSKTLLSRGVCDFVGKTRSLAMPYWDRYDEGVFVGGTFGGSPMHVDQVMWSNVGKNLLGHKLLAIWPYGKPSEALFDEHNYSLFIPPLRVSELAALEQCACVALLSPGDVVLFHGGNAHMALSVSRELSVTAYESFINLNPSNLNAFLASGTDDQYRQCRTRQPMLDDIKTDVAVSLNDLVEDVEDDVLQDAELEHAAPTAISLLRRDALIAKQVAPLRPPRRRRGEGLCHSGPYPTGPSGRWGDTQTARAAAERESGRKKGPLQHESTKGHVGR